MRSRLDPMKKVARMLRSAPRARPDAGPAPRCQFLERHRPDAINGKAQSDYQKGLRLPCSARYCELALYHALGVFGYGVIGQ